MKQFPKRVFVLCLCLFLLLVGWTRSVAAVLDGGAYYIVSDYYQKVLGVAADGSKPRLSAFGTNADADSYVFIAEASATDGFFYLKNKKSQAESAERPDPDADYREDDDGYDIPEESEEDDAEDFDDEEE